jgi:hypothetical protein
MTSNRGVPFNCPYCGRALVYLSSEREWHFYECEACGPITMPPNGRIRRTRSTDYPVSKPEKRKHGT